jgi:hypothetical protein
VEITAAREAPTIAAGGVPTAATEEEPAPKTNNIPDHPKENAPDAPLPRRSTRVPIPSAAGAAMRNLPYTSRTEQTVAEITSASTLARLAYSARKNADFEANFVEDMALAGIVHEDEDCQGTTPSPLRTPLRTPVPIPEVHLPVRNSASLPHLFRNSDVGTASGVKRAAWYAASRYRGVKANIASEYRAMALAAVKGVYSTGSLAAGILRLFSLDFPSTR